MSLTVPAPLSGHSFCRACLTQSLDHRNRCPLCRTVLLMTPQQLPTTVTLNSLIQKLYPVQHAQRALEEEQAAARLQGAGSEATVLLPLFVMDVVLPGQTLSLNVFEPRYRLMTRRVMAGNRRFGMVGVNQQRELLPVATEVEVLECEPLPDGRFFLEVVGRRRVRIMSSEEQDGYRLARVELELPGEQGRFRRCASREQRGEGPLEGEAGGDDDMDGEGEEEREAQEGPPGEPSDAPPPSTSLPALAQRADALVSVWLSRLRIGSSGAHAGYLASAGERPSVADPLALSWWVANVLPVPPALRYQLLAAATPAQRLSMELGLMRAAQNGEEACGVM